MLTGIMAGLSLLEGAQGANANRGAARAGISSIDRELSQLWAEREAVGKAATAKKGLLSDQYGNSLDSVIGGYGLNMQALFDQTDNATSRSGLSYSGSIQDKQSQQREEMENRHQDTSRSLYDSFRSSLIDIDSQRDNATGSIDSRASQLRGERDQYRLQSKERFLGIF